MFWNEKFNDPRENSSSVFKYVQSDFGDIWRYTLQHWSHISSTLAGSLDLSCVRRQLTAAILLLGPRSDGNRRRNFPCSAFASTCYA